MKKNNLKIVKIDKNKGLFNYEKKVLIKDLILDLKKLGLTVLLVEHVMELVMNVVDRIVVLNFGKKIAEGSPENIQNNEDVQKAYLGGA